MWIETTSQSRILTVQMGRNSMPHNQSLIEKLKRENASRESTLQLLQLLNHEFRSPLGTIRNSFDMLQNGKLSSEQQESVNPLENSIARLVQLLNDIDTLLKVESGTVNIESTSFGLQDCLVKVTELYQGQIEEKQIKLTTTIEQDVSQIVQGDCPKLSRLLHHLIENAVKYTPEGQINVSLTMSNQFPENANQLFVEFIIEDTGIGIPKNHLQKIQQFFRQTRPVVIPIGTCQLGLTLCKYLCDLMNGKIQVKSKIGEGTIFCVTIPLETVN